MYIVCVLPEGQIEKAVAFIFYTRALIGMLEYTYSPATRCAAAKALQLVAKLYLRLCFLPAGAWGRGE